jgi:hypothetical protein
MRWFLVEEDLPPEDDQLRWCYSEVFGTYHGAKWTAAQGWVDQRGSQFHIMTHWSDLILETPFAIGEYNEDIARQYKFKLDS